MSKQQATEEQMIYASLLNKGMKLGLLMVVVTFTVYVSGFLKPHIPMNNLSEYWGLPVHEYLKATEVHGGWWWLGQVGKGDFLNFIGIAFLSAVTIICYIAIMPAFLRAKDRVYFVLAIMEVLVLSLAASGILKGGGH